MITAGRRGSRIVGGAALAGALAITTAACGNNNTATPAITPPTVAPGASAACRDGLPHGPINEITVTVNGTERTALVHLPASPTATVATSEPLPVVLAFHGFSGSAAVQASQDGFAAQADEDGFVVVYPEGLLVGLSDQVTGASGWDPEGNEVDEPAFAAALLDELGAQTCIDPSRVYATGFSAGGYIAVVVACALPERIVAVATVAAAYQSEECPPTGRAIPTVAFQGLDDIVVAGLASSTRSGPFVPAFPAIEAAAARNGCSGAPETVAVTPTVESIRWTGCSAPTLLYQLTNHGHAWPGHPLPFSEDLLATVLAGNATQPPNALVAALGRTPTELAQNTLLTNVDIDATELIWDFFASLPGGTR